MHTMTPAPARRNFLQRLLHAVCAASAVMMATSSFAQSWPAKPIHLIVPSGVGSVGDAVARILSTHLSDSLGQPVLVENFPPTRGNPANGWGLFEMTGNEWTADWFAVDHFRTAVAAVNPKGPKRGVRKVARGGSYLCHESYCRRYRVSARGAMNPASFSGNTGFRCARDILRSRRAGFKRPSHAPHIATSHSSTPAHSTGRALRRCGRGSSRASSRRPRSRRCT